MIYGGDRGALIVPHAAERRQCLGQPRDASASDRRAIAVVFQSGMGSGTIAAKSRGLDFIALHSEGGGKGECIPRGRGEQSDNFCNKPPTFKFCGDLETKYIIYTYNVYEL